MVFSGVLALLFSLVMTMSYAGEANRTELLLREIDGLRAVQSEIEKELRELGGISLLTNEQNAEISREVIVDLNATRRQIRNSIKVLRCEYEELIKSGEARRTDDLPLFSGPLTE